MSKKQTKRIVTKKTRKALNKALDAFKRVGRSFSRHCWGGGHGQNDLRERGRYVDAD